MSDQGRFFWMRTIAVVAAACAGPVQAQTRAQTSSAAELGSVTQRADGGLAVQGVTLGSFRLFPAMTAVVSYDDNIYNRRSPEVADGYARIAPSADLRSLWSRHSLSLRLDGDSRRYFDTSSENSDQFGLDVASRYDISRTTTLSATGSVSRRIEPRGTGGDVFLAGGPNTFDEKTVSLALRTLPGRLLLEVRGNTSRFDYLDNDNGSTVIDLSFRDFVSTSAGVRAGYAVGPGAYVFVDGSRNWARYPNTGAGLIDRASDGYAVNGGVRVDLNPLVGGEISLGYLRQNFDFPQFSDVSGVSYAASVFWNPTPLLSLNLRANRSVQRAPVLASAGIDQNVFQLSADYQPTRRILVTATGQYVRSSFRGVGVADDQFSQTVTARYNLNRYVDITGAVNLRQRNANVAERDYAGKSVRFGIVAKY